MLIGAYGLSNYSGPALVTRISDDGRWVLSTHARGRIILWDLQNTLKFFVTACEPKVLQLLPDGEHFVWQDMSDAVRVNDFHGNSKVLMKLPRLNSVVVGEKIWFFVQYRAVFFTRQENKFFL